MKKIVFLPFILIFISSSFYSQDKIQFFPMGHASLIIKTDSITIFVDPVSEVKDFSKYGSADVHHPSEKHHSG